MRSVTRNPLECAGGHRTVSAAGPGGAAHVADDDIETARTLVAVVGDVVQRQLCVCHRSNCDEYHFVLRYNPPQLLELARQDM